MARRELSSEEQTLWSALTRSVRPLRPGARRPDLPALPSGDDIVPRLTAPLSRPTLPPPARVPSAMLDSSWERRIRSGTLTPEMSIDLHGHSLAAAHARLNHALAAALSREVRVLLIVTGKPPKQDATARASRRGAIRGEIGHWLETNPHADRIASVRLAHPRHGGDGALYIILRRRK